ncbi:MAG: hypothetical protein RQ966_10520 [Acetobacteraceae bacterium]|nr:hypothetical protein [Acetobacteraceae bacterium]
MRLAAALVVLALLGGGSARAADYCGYGHGTAVLFVDRTTAFDATDKTLFLQALDGLIGGLGAGDRLVLYTMTGAYTESQKLFDQCKPGCLDNGFFSDLMSSCRPVVARSDAVAFTRKLAETLAGLLQRPAETRFSDLFRTVADALRPYVAGPQKLLKVYMFSDLIENSTLLPERELKRLPPAAAVQRLQAAGVMAAFGGAEVRVFGFGRDDSLGRPPLPQAERQRIAQTWRLWFAAGGAGPVEIGFR